MNILCGQTALKLCISDPIEPYPLHTVHTAKPEIGALNSSMFLEKEAGLSLSCLES